ncbi:nucleoid occlusion protein [Acetonema longum]|uniref:ParB-like partition protein n=1 Tax=Acetonema longum DSM 6540 TaxID=1009370 RepID=F7NFX2_9FIRM|nr:nucleoid occlusion protein [Acetonema longum]EGO65080.1 parB-like partition protein [Acetonema longum DSM 6540]
MKNFAKLIGINQDDSKQADNIASPPSPQVQQVAVSQISPNPFQPRKTFLDESLQELAASIHEFGIIQPLIVRQTDHGIELIAGERRLRASKLAGLTEVPVIFKTINDREMAELAMIENLQREDLHYLEEAEGYQTLISQFGLTQEEMARRVGKNQSTIANKLRLLKLDADVRQSLRQNELTERHARALLKLDNTSAQMEILEVVKEKGLNVRETEKFIEQVLEDAAREEEEKSQPKQHIIKVIKDVRIFINTINNVVTEMKKTGLNIKMDQNQDNESIIIQLRIPKNR